MTFVDFDICHRMVSLQKLQCVNLTYFLEVKIKFYFLSKGKILAQNLSETLWILTFAIER